jgi:hypothetical protein
MKQRGLETWFVKLKEEHTLGMHENKVLMRVFGPRKDEVTVSWRKLHNEELHHLPSKIRVSSSRVMRWAGHVAHMVERENECRILVGKPEGKIPQERPRCRWRIRKCLCGCTTGSLSRRVELQWR